MRLRNYLPKVPIMMGLVGALLNYAPFSSKAEAAIIPVGAGAYTTDLPAGAVGPSDQNNGSPKPKVTADFNQKVVTNDWWTTLIWNYNPADVYSNNLYAHPFSLKAVATGIEVGYPTTLALTPYHLVNNRNVQEYHYPHKRDLTLGVVGLSAPDTRVKSYTDWTVTANWAGANQTFTATFGKGLPFVYIEKTGGDALVAVTGAPTIWQNANGVVGLTINGHHYGVFGPAGSTWIKTGNNLQSTLQGANYYSVALLPDNQPATLEFFRKHAYAFVTNTEIAWNYDEPTATVTTTYTAQTVLKEPGPNNSNVNKPLMVLYRHQWLNSAHPFLSFTYSSPRGVMKVVDDSQFVTKTTFSGVIPFLPNIAQDGTDTYSSNQLYGYVDAIYKQTHQARWNNVGNATDTYWTGKALGKIAQLIPIADQAKHGAARDLFIAESKQILQNWYDGQLTNVFYYNALWKSLIGYPASYGSNTELNDHHFHYGYFVMASSIIAHYDPAWAAQNAWGGMVGMLIRDANNWDRADALFPFLRHFDVYEGHSWASGAAAFGSGANEESSSEDFNFITAVILWGALTNNKAIRDLGIFLYTSNVEAVSQYWFDVDKAVFPTGFIPVTLGMTWGNGGAYSIWWNGTVQEVHGINFLPIQPGMLYLGQFPDYLKINQTFMLGNNGTLTPNTWRDIHMSVRALYDPATAIADFNANPAYATEAGETTAHTYHWIHNINQLGRVDKSVTANVPTYQVFIKNGKRTHIAYNPGTTPLNVLFSDGVKVTVAPKTVATAEGSVIPPDTHTFSDSSTDTGEVVFSFTPNWPTASVQLNYNLNSGALVTVAMINNNNIWQATVSGLKDGDSISYYYSYEDTGNVVNSAVNQHVYKCAGGGPTPPPPIPPTPNILDNTTDYVLKAQPTIGAATIVFTPKQASKFVDLHYKINGGKQLNYRMANTSADWTFLIPNLKDQDKLDLSFTYTVNGGGRDSKAYVYTYSASAAAN